MQELLNIHNNMGLMGNELRLKPMPEVLKEVQEYISKHYSVVLKDSPDDSRELIKSYIQKYLEQNSIGVANTEQDELCDLLYGEMTGFSFLSKYIYRDDVEEVNINQWRDVKVTYSNGDILPSKEKFNSAQHAIDVIRRMLHKSGMIFDSAQTIVVGHLSNKIRITVAGDGVIDKDKGLSSSIRLINPKQLTKEQFVEYGTATVEMLDLLSTCLCHGVSMCITGATGSGKTTLLSWVLQQIPHYMRIVTIEQGCREMDLTVLDEHGNILNNVVHLVTRSSDDPKQNVNSEKLVITGLTMNPDIIGFGEMKDFGSEEAVNAANTGHTVITTIHANSCVATYFRMVTLCKKSSGMDDNTLIQMTTQAFPIVVFAKKLEDNSRRIMEIAECIGIKDGAPITRTLFCFNITDSIIIDGRPKIIGHYEKVNNPSEGLQKRLRENGMPLKLQEQIFGRK